LQIPVESVIFTMFMGVTVIATSGTGVAIESLSTTTTDINPNLDSVVESSQEMELKSIKKNNNYIMSLIMCFIE